MIHTSIPTVSAVLGNHASALGHDFVAYRNHVYRVVNLCLAIAGGGDRIEAEKIAVAAVFHDLGIWTDHTFDYIAPSVALAREHLSACAHADWIPEIEAMIVDHHKITRSQLHGHGRNQRSGCEDSYLAVNSHMAYSRPNMVT